MYKENFNERLKYARLNAGYTQKQIEEILGIKQTTLSKMEKGKQEPDIEILGKLIDFYEISADWLLGTGITRK